MKTFLLIIITAYMVVSCNSNKSSKLNYLALGDSYTIGESVAPTDRYPNQIVDSLRSLGVDIANAEIIATTGWTSSDLLRGISNTITHEPYDLVSLLIGVNNQYQGMDTGIYKKEFEQLLDTAIRLAGNHSDRVVVFSIPDWGVTAFAKDRNPAKIAQEIDEYNAINKAITLSRNITWIDVTEISRWAATNPTLIADDGLHPSGMMYKEWTQKAIPEIIKMIQL